MVMYPIGAFAKLTGVTPKALYLYERRGLITPRRSKAGYRRYTLRDLHQLERVLALKSLGLSLTEIARLRAGTKAALPEVLARQRVALEEKRQRIDRAISAVDAIVQDAHPTDALHRFFGEDNWNRWEAKRRAEAAPGVRAPDRASPSRLALFHRIRAALDRDPSGASARPLVAEWEALLVREADGDADAAAAKRDIWKGRERWPDGMRRYVASLYDTDPATWARIAGFIMSSCATGGYEA